MVREEGRWSGEGRRGGEERRSGEGRRSVEGRRSAAHDAVISFTRSAMQKCQQKKLNFVRICEYPPGSGHYNSL